MNTRDDILTGVKTQLEMISTSTLFSDITINNEIWSAYLWVCGRHQWPKLEKASFRTTTTNYYYDQPSEFRADSVFLIVIGDQEYDPTEYEDYLRFKRDYPNNSDEFLFSMFADQIFIEPASAAGIEMVVWGCIQPNPFVNGSSITIFSNSEEEVNEAIMHKVVSALLPGDVSKSNNELLKAQSIADEVWNAIKARKARFHRKNAVFFDVPDMFPKNNNSISSAGNFRGR